MKITRVETLRIEEHPNLLWVRIHTDDGFVGLGETYFGAATVEAYIHEFAGSQLIGADPLAINALSRKLDGYLGFRSSGAEVRGNSAIDIALWDLMGKVAGQPIWQLLGGKSRDSIRIYNTCAGTHYGRARPQQAVSNWGLQDSKGRYDDLNAFLTRADELAVDLLESGVSAMKIWPFDPFAEASGGNDITTADLKKGLEPFEKIRSAVGEKMDIMVEFHSLWKLLPAMRIAKALAAYDSYWHEDPIRMDSLGSLRRYAAVSQAPICASETLGSRWAFRDLLETEVAGVVMLDLSWCGGITEARAIADMAAAWHLPVAPHDCTGPVVLAASTHLSLAMPNALIQETVRAFYNTWYPEIVTELPPISNGMIAATEKPGLGLELHTDFDQRFTVAVVSSDLE